MPSLRLQLIACLVLSFVAASTTAHAGGKRTALLLPFATSSFGFDTSFSLANTTADPFGDKTASGACTLSYFSQNGAPVASQTTAEVAPGGMFTFVLSSGGSHGIQARPGFQGYVIVDCAFSNAVATAYITAGPNFLNAASVPVTEIKAKDRK